MKSSSDLHPTSLYPSTSTSKMRRHQNGGPQIASVKLDGRNASCPSESGRFSPERSMCRLGCDYAGDATSFADSFLRFARAEEAALEGGDCSHLVRSFARDMPEKA